MINPNVALIAGHHGQRGGVCVGNFAESVYVLGMARKVREKLWPMDRAQLVRKQGEKLSLEERGQGIAAMGAGLAISIHVDNRPIGSPSGCFVFHWPGNYRGTILAKEICRHMPGPLTPTAVYPADEKWWPRVRNVLQAHPANCISLLIEIGDAKDAGVLEYIQSEIGEHRIALAIASGALYWMDQEGSL